MWSLLCCHSSFPFVKLWSVHFHLHLNLIFSTFIVFSSKNNNWLCCNWKRQGLDGDSRHGSKTISPERKTRKQVATRVRLSCWQFALLYNSKKKTSTEQLIVGGRVTNFCGSRFLNNLKTSGRFQSRLSGCLEKWRSQWTISARIGVFSVCFWF